MIFAPLAMNVGLIRSAESISVITAPVIVEALKQCYNLLFRSKMRLEAALEKAEPEVGQVAEVRYFIDGEIVLEQEFKSFAKANNIDLDSLSQTTDKEDDSDSG